MYDIIKQNCINDLNSFHCVPECKRRLRIITISDTNNGDLYNHPMKSGFFIIYTPLLITGPSYAVK